MKRRCVVCRHPEVREIDEAIAGGLSANKVALRFFGSAGSHGSVVSHARDCLNKDADPAARNRGKAVGKRVSRALAKVAVERVALESRAAIIGEYEALYARALTVYAAAEAVGDWRLSLAASKECRELLGCAARLQGLEQSGVFVDARTLHIEQNLAALSVEELRAIATADQREAATLEGGVQ